MKTPEQEFFEKFGVKSRKDSKGDQSYLAWIRLMKIDALKSAGQAVGQTDQTPPMMPSEAIAKATEGILNLINHLDKTTGQKCPGKV